MKAAVPTWVLAAGAGAWLALKVVARLIDQSSVMAPPATTEGNWWHGAVIDLQAFAIAVSAVAGAYGAALWAKKDTEPKP
jgi:hypothetical protein